MTGEKSIGHARRAVARRRGRWIVAGAAALGVFFAGALSADSQAPQSGGFLFSQYLKQSPGDPFAAGSFVAAVERPFFASGARRLSREAAGHVSAIPARRWALDAAFDDASADDIADRLSGRAAGAGWEIAGLAVDWAEEELFAAAGSGFGPVKNVGVDVNSDLGGRPQSAAVYGMGSLYDTRHQALAVELRGFVGGNANNSESGGSWGVIYRRGLDGGSDLAGAMAGLNLYNDYEVRDIETFSRWSLGGEFRSQWFDLFGNYYIPATDEIKDGRETFYTAEGLDAQIHLHSPSRPWLSGILAYYRFEGQAGLSKQSGLRAGVRLRSPTMPFLAEIEYDAGQSDDELGAHLSYSHDFSRAARGSVISGISSFRPQDWFFAPAEREYTQRIRVATEPVRPFLWTLDSVSPAGSAVSIRGEGLAAVAVALPSGAFAVNGTGPGIPVTETESWPVPVFTSVTINVPDGSDAVFSYGGGRGEVRLAGDATFNGDALQISFVEGALSISAAPGAAPEVLFNGETLLAPDAEIVGAAGAAGVFTLSADSGTGMAAVGGNFGNAAGCEDGPRDIGSVSFVCALMAYFADLSGNPIAPSGLAVSIVVGQASTAATLVVSGGGGSAVAALSEARNTSAGALTFDAMSGVAAVQISSRSQTGDVYTLEVEARDGGDSSRRQPSVTATLVVSVRTASFFSISARLEGVAGVSVNATASEHSPVAAATVVASGGSGSLAFAIIGDESPLSLSAGGTAAVLYIPATEGQPFDSPESILTATVEVSDGDSSNSARTRLTVRVRIADIIRGVAPLFGGGLGMGNTAENPLPVLGEAAGGASVAVATLSVFGGTQGGTISFSVVAGDSELALATVAGETVVLMAPGIDYGRILSIAVMASDGDPVTPDETGTLHVLSAFPQISIGIAGAVVDATARANLPVAVATVVAGGGSGAFNFVRIGGGESALSLSASAGGTMAILYIPATDGQPFNSSGAVLEATVEASDSDPDNDATERVTVQARIADITTIMPISAMLAGPAGADPIEVTAFGGAPVAVATIIAGGGSESFNFARIGDGENALSLSASSGGTMAVLYVPATDGQPFDSPGAVLTATVGVSDIDSVIAGGATLTARASIANIIRDVVPLFGGDMGMGNAAENPLTVLGEAAGGASVTVATLGFAGGALGATIAFSVVGGDSELTLITVAPATVIVMEPGVIGRTLSIEVMASDGDPTTFDRTGTLHVFAAFPPIVASFANGVPDGGTVILFGSSSEATPAATIAASGGSGSYEYALATGGMFALNASVLNLPAGSYASGVTLLATVEVSDANSDNESIVTISLQAEIGFPLEVMFLAPDGGSLAADGDMADPLNVLGPANAAEFTLAALASTSGGIPGASVSFARVSGDGALATSADGMRISLAGAASVSMFGDVVSVVISASYDSGEIPGAAGALHVRRAYPSVAISVMGGIANGATLSVSVTTDDARLATLTGMYQSPYAGGSFSLSFESGDLSVQSSGDNYFIVLPRGFTAGDTLSFAATMHDVATNGGGNRNAPPRFTLNVVPEGCSERRVFSIASTYGTASIGGSHDIAALRDAYEEVNNGGSSLSNWQLHFWTIPFASDDDDLVQPTRLRVHDLTSSPINSDIYRLRPGDMLFVDGNADNMLDTNAPNYAAFRLVPSASYTEGRGDLLQVASEEAGVTGCDTTSDANSFFLNPTGDSNNVEIVNEADDVSAEFSLISDASSLLSAAGSMCETVPTFQILPNDSAYGSQTHIRLIEGDMGFARAYLNVVGLAPSSADFWPTFARHVWRAPYGTNEFVKTTPANELGDSTIDRYEDLGLRQGDRIRLDGDDDDVLNTQSSNFVEFRLVRRSGTSTSASQQAANQLFSFLLATRNTNDMGEIEDMCGPLPALTGQNARAGRGDLFFMLRRDDNNFIWRTDPEVTAGEIITHADLASEREP